MRRVTVTLALCVGCIVAAQGTYAQSRGSQAVLDGAKFVQDFTRQVQSYYNDQIVGLQAERGNASASRRAQIDRQIGQLQESKRLAGGYDKAWRVFNYAKSIHDTLAQVEGSLNQSDTWDTQIVWLDRLAGAQLAQGHELIQKANTAMDYGSKLKSLRDLMQSFDGAVPSDQVKTMVNGLNGLFWVFKEFGDKVPALGAFMKNYGEVGSALVNASWRLHQRLQQRAGGLLVDGYRDDGRIAAFDRQLPHLAGLRDTLEINPLPGVRDAYTLPAGGVLIWDPVLREWHERHDITPSELVRRYAFCATYGETYPTVDYVLTDPRHTIGIRLTPADTVVAPGGSTTITITAVRMDRAKPPIHIRLNTVQEATLGSYVGYNQGNGSLDHVAVEPDQTVTWTAPNTEHYVYRVTADLGQGEGGLLVGQPFCLIATGKYTKVVAEARPASVLTGGDGMIVFQLLDSSNQPTAANGRFRLYGNGLQLGDAQSSADGTGGWVPYYAPERAGEYWPVVSFSGYVDAGWLYGENTMASQAAVKVRVKARPDEVAVQPPPPPDPGPGPAPTTFQGSVTQEWHNYRENEMREACQRSRSVLETYTFRMADILMLIQNGVATIAPNQVDGYETYDYRVTQNARVTTRTTQFTWAFLAGAVNADGTIGGQMQMRNTTGGDQREGTWHAVLTDGGRTCLVYLSGFSGLPPLYRLRAQ